MQLSSRFGQQYQCAYEPLDDSHRRQEEQVALETGIVELLRPMSQQPCIVQVNTTYLFQSNHPFFGIKLIITQ